MKKEKIIKWNTYVNYFIDKKREKLNEIYVSFNIWIKYILSYIYFKHI